jgi:hypothetical protein
LSRANRTGFKGVSWCNGYWRARIKLGDNEMFLGHFATPELAAAAYDTAAIKYHGEFAMTNLKLGTIGKPK